MGWFNSYSAEYQELLDVLVNDWHMKEHFARAFLDAYRRKIGKMVASARKKAAQVRAANLSLGGTMLALDMEDPNLVIASQAYHAYMTDLRRGRFVGTDVEKAIWAILAHDCSGAMLEHVDAFFAEYIDDEHEKLFPNLFQEVFSELPSP